ncbi:hypothetical protein NEIPOLOT_00807 [Neisseria polysaccharea ATCC 43768]|nr:hypothetical protein NEIPOLOT_00807 [Neisseria polysaccharea ATCC 43768]
MHFGIDAQFAQGVEIKVLDIGGGGFEGDLELVIVLQAVGVVAVAAVFGAAAGLDVGGKPRLGTERAQAGGRVGSAGADFHIERLDDSAAFVCPECLQLEDDLLEGKHGLLFDKIKVLFYCFHCCLNRFISKAADLKPGRTDNIVD